MISLFYVLPQKLCLRLSSVRATCTVRPILLNLIILLTFRKQRQIMTILESSRIAQYSHYVTCWLVKVSGSIPDVSKSFSLLNRAQTGSGAHPASHSTEVGAVFQDHSGRGMKLTTLLYLIFRLRITYLYLHFPIRLQCCGA